MIIVNRIFFLVLGLILLNACNHSLVPVKSQQGEEAGYDTADYNIIFNDALKQKMLGNQANAIRLFERALKINSASDASYYNLSLLYQGVGDYNMAVKYGARAEKLDPLNSWYVENAGVQYYLTGRYDSAVYYYEKLSGLLPEREDIKLNLAGFYENAGEYEKAEDIINTFIDQYGEEEDLLISLIRIYGTWGKSDKTEKTILRLINSAEDKTRGYGILAEFYKQANREEDAISVYEKLYGMDPDNPDLQLSYVDFLRTAGKYDEFLVELNAVILNDSIDIQGKYNIFAAILNDHLLIKEKGDAIAIPTMLLLSSYPDNPDIVLLASQLFEVCGQDKRSVSTLQNYCQKNPDNYLMWERLLFAYSSRQLVDDLYTSAKYVATKFNLSPIPKLLLAYAANERGEYDLALGELDKALTLAGNNKELLIEITSLLASVYYQKGDLQKAFITFDKGLELSPDNAPMLNNYAYYLSEQDLRLKEARSMIEACLKIESNSTYLDTYAWILFKLGKYRRAEDIMNSLYISGAMESSEHYEHYGYIRKALGDCDLAVELWRKALEMDNTKTQLENEIEKCISEK